jgi:hypothetical protein
LCLLIIIDRVLLCRNIPAAKLRTIAVRDEDFFRFSRNRRWLREVTIRGLQDFPGSTNPDRLWDGKLLSLQFGSDRDHQDNGKSKGGSTAVSMRRNLHRVHP